MCTRYLIELSPELRPIIEEARRSSLSKNMTEKLGRSLITQGEVRPTNMVPVIAPDQNGKQKVFPMVWGFRLPGLSTPLVNARSETASRKPAFQESWLRRRCMIPASCYFEWEHITTNDGKKKTGDKYIIQPKNSTMTWLCGLYRFEREMPHFVILTKDAADPIRFIHSRMPLIMPEDKIDDWIRPDSDPENLLEYALFDMVAEKA